MILQNLHKKTVVVDIDGILTKETSGYGNEIYLKRTPNKRNIEILRDYKRRGFKIILHSARFPEDMKVTKEWLLANNVPYDELILGKPLGDVYIDDKAKNLLEKEVLCISGGLDSTIAYFYLHYPQPIYFKLGHQYEKKELFAIRALERKIDGFNPIYNDSLRLGWLEQNETAYIPLRNLYFAMVASNYGNKIYIVGVDGDKVEDKSPEAYRIMSFCLNFIRKSHEPEITIDSPFWNMSKGEIVKWFMDTYGKDFAKDILYTSISCYSPNILGQCGECPSCFRKWIAMEYAGIECIDMFEKNITKWVGINRYIKRVRAGEYSIKRTNEIIKVLKKYGLWI